MKVLVSVFLLVATVQAEQWCNYTAGRGESIFEAFPIATFSTSGADTVRQNWCITACDSRTSIKAAMLYQAAAKTPGQSEKLRISKLPSRNGPVKYINNKLVQQLKQQPTDFTYCVDPAIQAIVTSVLKQYDDANSIATQLNQQINKPGWAYLVVKMGTLPTENELSGLIMDPDFCFVSINKVNSQKVEEEFAIYSGLVHA